MSIWAGDHEGNSCSFAYVLSRTIQARELNPKATIRIEGPSPLRMTPAAWDPEQFTEHLGNLNPGEYRLEIHDKTGHKLAINWTIYSSSGPELDPNKLFESVQTLIHQLGPAIGSIGKAHKEATELLQKSHELHYAHAELVAGAAAEHLTAKVEWLEERLEKESGFFQAVKEGAQTAAAGHLPQILEAVVSIAERFKAPEIPGK